MTAIAIYSLGHGLCILTALSRSTQPCTRCGTVKWVSAFRLSNNNKCRWWMWIVAAYWRTHTSTSALNCAKVAEPIGLPFSSLGCGLGWVEGSTSWIVFARWRQCALMGGHIAAIWRVRLNRPSAAEMQPYVKLLWTCYGYYYYYPQRLSFCQLIVATERRPVNQMLKLVVV